VPGIQDINDQTRHRKIRTLNDAMSELNLKEGDYNNFIKEIFEQNKESRYKVTTKLDGISVTLRLRPRNG